VAGSVTISVALPAEMVQAERQRLSKELEKLEALLERTRKKLENPGFASRAPAQVVQTERERLETGERQRAVLRDKLKQLR
jgi:valyl-tRNA synthetase